MVHKMLSEREKHELTLMFHVSKARHTERGKRIGYAVDWFVRQHPEYAGYRNRLYDYCLHVLFGPGCGGENGA